jgi:alcohol dehydrogenase class IV
MPESFNLQLGSDIIFGAGRLQKLGDGVTARLGPGARLLLIADPALGKLAGKAEAALAGAGHKVARFDGLTSDPRADQIEAAADRARTFGADGVVGLGGGSALDVAKMTAAVTPGSRGVAHYALNRNELPRGSLFIVAVPTTSGTGAEVTRTVVYSDSDGVKLWTDADCLRPGLVVLDPELTVGMPAPLTANTGVDALVHAIESTTNTSAHCLNDGQALQAIALIANNLPRAVREPRDLEARGAMQIAACLAGLAIDACGTAVAHALGHALGTLFGVHHGRAVGLSLGAALPGNAVAWPARHARVARAFGLSGENDEALAAALPGAYDAFLKQVGVAPLNEADGMRERDLERIVEMTQEPQNLPMLRRNCYPLDGDALGGVVGRLLSTV